MNYTGSAHDFELVETANGANYDLDFTWDVLPDAAELQLRYRVIGSPTWIVASTTGPTSGASTSVPLGNNEYSVRIINTLPTPSETITFEPAGVIYIPELNPVIFYDTERGVSDKYQTKFFDTFQFAERLYPWQARKDYCQIWQTTDVIKLQFESTFTDIVVNILDSNNGIVVTTDAVVGLENEYIDGMFSYEAELNLTGLSTGIYNVQIICGEDEKILISDKQYISSTSLENTVLLEYWNSRFHKDIVFETGIQFQFRIPGKFGFLDKARKDEQYRNEQYTNTLLNSRAAKQWPVWFGDEYGLPDDIYNLIDEIFGCDNVLIDAKPFSMADGTKPEPITIDESGEYPKRGMKITVEQGISRNSRIFA